MLDPYDGFRRAASWLAGGMLAPWCERESADDAVLMRGLTAADKWEAMVPGEVRRNGTLVVASARDLGELRRFACRTTGYEWLEEPAIAALEPSLGGRFRHGLFFRREAHLDPRRVLCLLRTKLTVQGVTFVGESPHESFDSVVDCTGAARIGEAKELRGVRGEMLYLRSFDVDLSRPVRLLHPRFPVYIVPRGDGVFMVGATMIETEFGGPICRPFTDGTAQRCIHAISGLCRCNHNRNGCRNSPSLSGQSSTCKPSGNGDLAQRPLPPRLSARAIHGGRGG